MNELMVLEPLSKADFALLRMDSPDNRMIVTALVTLETRLEIEDLKTMVEHLLMRFPRFRQRVVQSHSPIGAGMDMAYWETVDSIRIDRHLKTIRTPLPRDSGLLQELVSRLMSVGLDFSEPLWQFYLVERYGEGSALVTRFHHCMADGIYMMRVLLSMTQAEPGKSNTFEKVAPKPTENQLDLKPGNLAPKRQMSTGKNATRRSIRLSKRIRGRLALTGRNLLALPMEADDLLRLGSSISGALGQLILSPPDAENPFRGQTSVPKRAAWSPMLSLDRVKLISRTFNCTVNDVLISIVTGALRCYIVKRTGNPIPANLHTFVPIDLRRGARLARGEIFLRDGFDQPMGNRFGFAILDLPVGIENPLERLQIIQNQMDMLKASGEALVSYAVLSLMGAAPQKVEDLAVRFWLNKGSTLMSNVPGPQQKLYLANSAIDTLMAWAPQSGKTGLSATIISYNGKVCLGVATDQGLVPDPECIVEYFLEELEWLSTQAALKSRSASDVLLLTPDSPSPPDSQALK